ncbi:MAG: DNA polymerase III subunit gamma/tau [bacterium]
MTYISLYRKYRSQTFDEIVGQSHITTTLKNAISSNRIAHAYLFSGPRGTGKTSTARIFAKALNCEKGPTPEPCNECDICDSVTRDVLFDVVEIDAASNRGIDDIRDIKEKVRVPPVQARYKVYIIDEVHMLSTPAFNALLKTLEEPPPNVIFILATTEAHKLLSTILSRCQRFDFRRIPTSAIHGHLVKIAENENFEAESDALATIAATADGSLRDAISILDQLVSFSGGKITAEHVSDVLGMIPGGEMLSFINALLDNDAPRCFELFDQFFQEGKSVSLFVRLLLEHFRDIYFLQAGMPVELSEPSLKDPIEKQAKKIKNPTLVKMLDETAKVEERVRWENYPRIVLEILIIKLLYMLHSTEAEERPQKTAAREKPAARRAAPAPRPPNPRRNRPTCRA